MHFFKIKINANGNSLADGPVVRIPPSLLRVWDQSVVGELRSHKPRSMAKGKKKKKTKQKSMPIAHEEQKSKIFRNTLCKTCLIGTKQTLFIRTIPTGHNLII